MQQGGAAMLTAQELKSSPLFHDISYEEYRRMLTCFQAVQRSYRVDEVIYDFSGPAGNAVGVVERGEASLIRIDEEGVATVLEELNKDYVEGAKARGVRGRVILWKSVLKSSMLTIITLLALSIGSLLGGTAIIESIFMWDGVGKLAVDAITMRDYPLIQAYVVWMAIIYVMVNLITDLLYHALDPRIRLGVSEV